MPQMSPLWWTSLMMTFTLTFLILMSILYFNLNNKMKSGVMLNTKKMNWKW